MFRGAPGGAGGHRSEAMGRDSIPKLLLRFSGPAIIASMVTSSYNMVDAIFVGKLGTEALAAIAVAFPLMGITMAIGMGTALGGSSLISRQFGAKKYDEASKVAGTCIGTFTLLGAILTVVLLLNLESLLRLFGATDAVLPLARSYMFVETVFLLINFLLMLLAEFVRTEGNPVLASASMITSGLMNCIWDPILIWGFGPFPAMGIAGAALATTVGRGIGTAMILVYFISGRTSYRFKPSYFLPNFKIMAEVYRVGISGIVRMGAGSLSHVLVNRAAAAFGVIPLAVLGVLFRASSFAFMPLMGLGQGVLPLVGYNYGANQKGRVGEVVMKVSLLSFGWGALCWIVAMLFATPILSIFNSDPQFLTEGSRAFRIFASVFFMIGTQMTLTMFFQGIGKGLPSLVLASARQIIFLIPAVLILPRLFGLTGLWMAHPAADVLSAVVTITWTIVEFRRQGIPWRLRGAQPLAYAATGSKIERP